MTDDNKGGTFDPRAPEVRVEMKQYGDWSHSIVDKTAADMRRQLKRLAEKRVTYMHQVLDLRARIGVLHSDLELAEAALRNTLDGCTPLAVHEEFLASLHARDYRHAMALAEAKVLELRAGPVSLKEVHAEWERSLQIARSLFERGGPLSQ